MDSPLRDPTTSTERIAVELRRATGKLELCVLGMREALALPHAKLPELLAAAERLRADNERLLERGSDLCRRTR